MVFMAGNTSGEFRHSLAALQCPGTHGRATKEGCRPSITAAGECDEDFVRAANLLPKGSVARTDVNQGAVRNFRFFKIVKSNATSMQSADGDANQGMGSPRNDLIT